MSSGNPTPPTQPLQLRTPAAVLSAHGGSAATTIARALRLPEVGSSAVPPGAVLVLTARTHATGADDVVAAMARVRANPVVLALTADAPRPEPAAVRAMRRLMADRFAAVIDLPYVARWRNERPCADNATGRWAAGAAQLNQTVLILTNNQGDPQ